MVAKFEVLRMVVDMANNLPESIFTKANALLSSGAIDLEQYEADYRLPKIILVACLEHLADQHRPDDKRGQAEVRNLAHF